MESGAVAGALFEHQRCGDEIGEWSLALLTPGQNTTLLSFGDVAPLPNTTYGALGPDTLDQHGSFLSLSPGDDVPALMHASAHIGDEISYSMLVDLEEPMPLEAELFCGRVISDPGPFGGRGAARSPNRRQGRQLREQRRARVVGQLLALRRRRRVARAARAEGPSAPCKA